MLGQGKKSKTASAKVDTIVGQQTRIEGDIHFSGGLHIDGRIKGGVIAESGSGSVLTVSEHGSIEGDVRVPTVILNGSVTGDVRSANVSSWRPRPGLMVMCITSSSRWPWVQW